MTDDLQIQPLASDAPANSVPPMLVLNKDLFFGVTIANTVRVLGYAPMAVRSAAAMASSLQASPSAALVIVDIAAVDDWEGLRAALAMAPGVPAIAFGSHTNVEGLRAAKRIGMTRVFSNGEFHRSMGATISRYALPI